MVCILAMLDLREGRCAHEHRRELLRAAQAGRDGIVPPRIERAPRPLLRRVLVPLGLSRQHGCGSHACGDRAERREAPHIQAIDREVKTGRAVGARCAYIRVVPAAGLEPAILLGMRSQGACVYQFRHAGIVVRPARLERASSGYESARSVQLSLRTQTRRRAAGWHQSRSAACRIDFWKGIATAIILAENQPRFWAAIRTEW